MCFGSGARFSGHVAVHFFQSEFSLQKTVCAGEPSTKTWSTKHGLALSFSKILWETLMDVIGNLFFWFQPQTSSRKMNKQFAATFTTNSLLEDVGHLSSSFSYSYSSFFFFFFLLLKNWHVLELLTVDIDLAGPESRSSDESAWLHYVPLNTHTKHFYLRNSFQKYHSVPKISKGFKRYVRYHISHNNIQQHTTTQSYPQFKLNTHILWSQIYGFILHHGFWGLFNINGGWDYIHKIK